jgi:hypothetical protein
MLNKIKFNFIPIVQLNLMENTICGKITVVDIFGRANKLKKNLGKFSKLLNECKWKIPSVAESQL